MLGSRCIYTYVSNVYACCACVGMIQWNLSKTTTCEPDTIGLYREVLVLLYTSAIGQGRLAVLERWLPNTVTILDRFHCTYTLYVLVCKFTVCFTASLHATVAVYMVHGHHMVYITLVYWSRLFL